MTPTPSLSLDIKTIRHVSHEFAQRSGILDPYSVITQFIRKYGMDDLPLVSYLGSELIGPSVQVAEIGGAVTSALWNSKNPFYLLDIFSGSGATCVPALQSLMDLIGRAGFTEGKHVFVRRVDDTEDQERALNRWLERRADGPKFCDLTFAKVHVFDDIRMRGRKTLKNDAKTRGRFDLIMADPPHFRALDFLRAKAKNGRPMVEALASKTRVFLLYYAHAEQMELCQYIRSVLVEAFHAVFRVVIGGEEMAVCCRKEEVEVIAALRKTLIERLNDYTFIGPENRICHLYPEPRVIFERVPPI